MTDILGDLFERRRPWRLFLCLYAIVAAGLAMPAVAKAQQGDCPALAARIRFRHPFSGSADSLLALLGREAGVSLAYSSRVIPPSPGVSISPGSHSLAWCLGRVFGRYNVRYVCRDGKIVVAADSVRLRTVSGFCRDAQTGEALIGAYVVDTLLRRAAATNEFGFFSLSVPTGSVPLRVSYIGYNALVRSLELRADTMVNLRLGSSLLLRTVEVRASESADIEGAQIGATALPMEQIRAMPTLMGEADVTRALQQTPGVQSGGEGFGGMSVRGGSQDQNMIYLDDAPLYNANHMLGLFSAFNSEAVSSARLIKSGFPARYGGRMASVLDVRTIDGNMSEFEGDANIGLMASSLLLQGPVVKQRSSYLFSARRTHFDLFSYHLQNDDNHYSYMFYDFHGKLNWVLSERDRLRLSFLYSRDELTNNVDQQAVTLEYGKDDPRRLTTSNEAQAAWGTILGSLRWTRALTPTLFVNTTLWYSQYRYENSQRYRVGVDAARGFLGNRYANGIHDIGARVDMSLTPRSRAAGKFRFGGWASYRLFRPLVTVYAQEAGGEDIFSAAGDTRSRFEQNIDMRRYECHAYVENSHKWGPAFATLGFHFMSEWAPGDIPQFVGEPRLLAGVRAGRRLAFKVGYSKTSQFLYQMRVLNVATPADLWLPLPRGDAPQRAHQLSVEVWGKLAQDLSLRVELYNKWMPHLVTYGDATPYDVLSDGDWDGLSTSGRGYARGFELFLHRRRGRLSGWVGYALSKSRGSYDQVNNGEWLPADNDRLHSVQLYAAYDLRPNVSISAAWSYSTGAPFSLPTQHYSVPGSPASYAVPARRNAMRMPGNHQLNIGVNVKYGDDHVGSLLSFGVYNAYARQNPVFVYWRPDDNASKPTYSLKQFSLIAIPWPFIKYSIHF